MSTTATIETCVCDDKQTLTNRIENISLNDYSQQQQQSSIGNSIPITNENADLSHMRKLLRNKLLNYRNDMEISRSQPNTPLYSAKTFEELGIREPLLKNLYDMGFVVPTKIQATVLPLVLAKPNVPNNLIVQSQSASGKSVAYVLASLCRVNAKLIYPQVIILLPAYELAIQIGEMAQQIAKYEPQIKFRLAVRGENLARGSHVTEHIIIGTPEKLMDWAIKFRMFDLKLIKVFVLDDTDVMIDTQGHRQQSIRIQKSLSPDCQMMLFSVTYEQNVMEFAEMIIQDPVIIKLKREEMIADNINQYYLTLNAIMNQISIKRWPIYSALFLWDRQ